MKRASQFLSEVDRKAVSDAVAEAENGTSAEIVPVIATASGRYDRAEDIFGLLVGIIAWALAWTLVQGIEVTDTTWSESPRIALGLIPGILILVIGFAAGSALATYFPVLRLPFIMRKEMLKEVDRSAHEVFSREGLRRTRSGTGVLIYVSLYERIVRILPDDAIAEKMDAAAWVEVKDQVINGIREGRPAEGIAQAVAKCGEILKAPFPIEPGDVNELRNELRIID